MDIIELLKKSGPMLSSSIKKMLLDDGFSDEAARQKISSLASKLKRYRKPLSPPNFLFILRGPRKIHPNSLKI